mmetsp:Transcript_30299/g.46258  ORF Transcript_30299/g.46258 Transcript_30299/m.46258 type:complete len:102 (-) Transcript_30299:235-540(-)
MIWNTACKLTQPSSNLRIKQLSATDLNAISPKRKMTDILHSYSMACNFHLRRHSSIRRAFQVEDTILSFCVSTRRARIFPFHSKSCLLLLWSTCCMLKMIF